MPKRKLTGGTPQSNKKGKSPIASPSTKVSKTWQSVHNAFGKANWPYKGLPVNWKKKKGKFKKTVYDPSRKITLNIDTQAEKIYQKSPVQFIKATTDKVKMPGTKKPDSVRYQRYSELKKQGYTLTDHEGYTLVPCLAHGDFVRVESLQADHIEAKQQILKRQRSLVSRMNSDKRFAKLIKSLSGMDKFFIKAIIGNDKKAKWYGTLYYYTLYFNDIDNLWLICQACNLKKSNEKVFTWFQRQWPYGKDFLNYLQKLSAQRSQNNKLSKFDMGIIQRVGKDQAGLASAAMKWFWKHHASYISNAKTFFEEVVNPIKILDRAIDELCMSSDAADVEVAEELQAGRKLIGKLAAASTNTERLLMPSAARKLGQRPLKAYEKNVFKRKKPSIGEFKQASEEFLTGFPKAYRKSLSSKVEQKAKNRASKKPRV
jgi:hypothetical protein